MTPLPCICCGKELEAVMSGEDNPYRGTVFFSHGNYGSTVFDEIDGTGLEITVCDECLVAAGQKGNVLLLHELRRPVDVTKSPWTGPSADPRSTSPS
jgi:hypothetical protein